MDVAVPGVSAPTPAISPAAAPETVWISILTQDVTALGEEFNFPERKPAGQNGVLSVYELRAAELDRLGDIMQRKFRRSPGFFAHSSLRSAQQDFTLPPLAAAAAYTIDQGEKVSTMLQLVDESSITGMISTLSAYKTRYYRSVTGIAAPKWLYGYWTQLAAGRPDISVATFRHSAFPQESVILTVTGAVEPEKVIVIGGHIDCTSGGADNPAPGADDNASGIAVTNEVLRVLIASGYRPAQTLKFMAFAAEEAGLRGSAEIAAAFKKQGVAVQGMLNLDMANFKGSAQDINFVTDNTNSDQNAFLGKLVDIYTPYTWATFKCGYGCSDHASWTKNGYPASLPFESKMEEYNPAIHTANDTLEQMGGRATHAVKFAKLAVAYMVELAK
ncbi:MAG: hypothetical protein A2234_10405 [Elusimicrobia bacterium RIFOXYA2_FULL_58_8]|nr:MAG: hypothetical protein A2285_04270 [Elusimicrobia bacterium RIFOXYA12_FULL_57_11]OGS14587.1 MAG: hypothetical protein A2234_10405 [Elusimicrobia bacterium RIFOXYA2_FULL_58_8]